MLHLYLWGCLDVCYFLMLVCLLALLLAKIGAVAFMMYFLTSDIFLMTTTVSFLMDFL